MQAVIGAATRSSAGDGDLFVAGGVESMTRAPFVMAKPSAAFPRGEQTLYDTTLGWRFTNPRLADAFYPYSMGETAENVVERCGVTPRGPGRVRARVAPALGRGARGGPLRRRGRADRGARRQGRHRRTVDRTSTRGRRPPLEQLAALKPAFKRDASGIGDRRQHQSGINDGAAALLVTSEARAAELGLRPIARLLSSAVAGVDPATMGLGPIPASARRSSAPG